MSDYSLVPVDHQPDFGGVTLIPVDHDPFGPDGMVQSAGMQPVQPRQVKIATTLRTAGLPVMGTPVAFGGSYNADFADAGVPGRTATENGGGSLGGVGSNGFHDGGGFNARGDGIPFQQVQAVGSGTVPLYDENGMIDSYVHVENSMGAPPDGPNFSSSNGNIRATANRDAGRTNSGGVFGHSITLSEPGTSKLATISGADPTGLRVATPITGNPGVVALREYKGY